MGDSPTSVLSGEVGNAMPCGTATAGRLELRRRVSFGVPALGLLSAVAVDDARGFSALPRSLVDKGVTLCTDFASS